jgi:hypothetical protein
MPVTVLYKGHILRRLRNSLLLFAFCLICSIFALRMFQGRPYDQKMRWDRVEMLYWLQEERKQNAIKYEALRQQMALNLKTAHLDPIPQQASAMG